MIFQVLDEKGSPMKGETVLIKDEEDGRTVYAFGGKTDDNGMTQEGTIPMKSRQKSVVVVVRGLEKLIHLYR